MSNIHKRPTRETVMDIDLLTVALEKVVHHSRDVTPEDVAVMVRDPVFHAYILGCAVRLAGANNGEQLFSIIASIFHLGLETGVAYRELQRPQ